MFALGAALQDPIIPRDEALKAGFGIEACLLFDFSLFVEKNNPNEGGKT